MSAATVASVIVAWSDGLVKFVIILAAAFGVDPGVEFAYIDRLSLPANRDNLEQRADLRVEYGPTHGQIRRCFADAN